MATATVTLAPSRLAPDADRPETIAADLEQPVLSPLAGSDRDRFARGRLIHTLLQRLPDVPADARRKRAKAYLARPGHGLAVEQIDEILDATFGVLDDPDTAWLFGEGTLAEVAVAATLPLRDAQDREVAISGQVDRLAVRDDEVMIVDYKTNRPAADDVADVHPAYLRQMAAYRLALGRIYPGRTVRAALLWTDGPRFMELPPDALDAAFSGDRASSDIHN